MLAGVAAGLADYLNVEVTWIRVLFICLTIFGFSGVWIYIILWIAVPAKVFTQVPIHGNEADYRIYEENIPKSNYFGQANPNKKERDNSIRYITGMILIALGSYFLLDEFFILPDWISIEKLWPLVFVAIGLVILAKPSKNKEIPKKETPFEDNEKSSPGEEPIR